MDSHDPLRSSASSPPPDQLQKWCSDNCNMLGFPTPSNNSMAAEEHFHLHSSRERPPQYLVWISGLSFVTVIGLCAVVGILVMRCLRKSTFNRFITFFVSVGVGSLSGSAVFHLLPQAFGLADELQMFNGAHQHGAGRDDKSGHGGPAAPDYLYKSFAAVVGIYLFFFTDKIIKIVLEMRKRSKKEVAEMKKLGNDEHQTKRQPGHAHYGHSHNSGSNGPPTENGQQSKPTDTLLGGTENTVIRISEEVGSRRDPAFVDPTDSDRADESINQQTHALCVHDHDYKHGDSAIATVAWMIIFGDGLHNFIDGITIGASFSESLLSGISVSVAVLCEEFPHELGDVAILVNAGMSMKQTLMYNVLSALSCYVGFAIGVLVGNIDDTFAAYTFGFAGGMFLYISLGCMMPEMKNAMERALDVSLKKGLEVLALQASGVITGLSCMYVMARYGENIEF